MRHNHTWAARKQRRPINPIFALQCIGAGALLVVGLGIVTLIMIAAGA